MPYRSRTFPATINDVSSSELDLLDSSNGAPTSGTAWGATPRIAYAQIDMSNAAIGNHVLVASMPNNVLVTGCWYTVDTTFTSGGGDAAELSISVNGVNIVAPTAISGGGNIWDAGNHGVSLSNPISCSTSGPAQVTVATQAVTSNSTITVWIEYFQYGNV